MYAYEKSGPIGIRTREPLKEMLFRQPTSHEGVTQSLFE